MNTTTPSRTVRVFLSSTFRDFAEERDLLVRKVFPELRRKCRERQVELVDVDLRWGITEKEAQQGRVLPICLAEVDRSRPWFMGFIGERYGWVPAPEQFDPAIVQEQPWLEEHRGGKSVTELEILHGVLNNPKMAGRAFFYFRDSKWSKKKGSSYLSEGSEEKAKLEELKDRIRQSGFPVQENYPSPEALAVRVKEDLWKLIDEAYPESQVPDALTRERMVHEAYAATRCRLYLGGEAYFKALDEAMKAKAFRPVLITGQSGGGKSALVANWGAQWSRKHPKTAVIVHHLGSGSDAADPVRMAVRLMREISRLTGDEFKPESDPEKQLEFLPQWLALASAWAQRSNRELLIVLDGLDKVSERKHLRWFPGFLPLKVKLVTSCLHGEILEAAKGRLAWQELKVKPFTKIEQKSFISEYLGRYRKALTAKQMKTLQGHPLSVNPLFLLTVLEELRVFGVHEELEQRMRTLLSLPPSKGEGEAPTVDDVFEHVLARIEKDLGKKAVRQAMEAIWASRAGLYQDELLAIAKLAPAKWAAMQNALDESLYESSGKIAFGHDYLRKAVEDRYGLTGKKKLKLHRRLAEWFAGREVDERVADELPWQWLQASDWRKLQQLLTNLDMFDSLSKNITNEEHLSYWLSLEQNSGRQLLEPLLQNAWDRWQLPVRKECTGAIANRLALFLRYTGRGFKSNFRLRLARLALDTEKRIYGANHMNTAVRLSHLGLCYEDLGKINEAKKLYRRALAITEKALGPDHPTTAIRLNNLALALNDSGDHAAAEHLCRRALAITEKKLGPDHPTTAIRLNNLALALNDSGDHSAAERLYRRALAITEKALGPDHPTTAIRLNNLASALNDSGDHSAAEPLYRLSLAIRERALGSDHPDTAISLAGLALLLKERGDVFQAEPLYRRALAITQKAFGPEHPTTAIRLNNLAMLLDAKGSKVEAEKLFRHALAIKEKYSGRYHSDTVTSMINLACFLQDNGAHAEAEPFFRQAVAILEKSKTRNDTEFATLLWSFADCLSDLGKNDEAIELLLRELAITEEKEGANCDSAARTHQRLGILLREEKRYLESKKQFCAALLIFESLGGRKTEAVAKVLNGLGKIENKLSNFSVAIRLFDESLKIRRKVSPENKTAIKSLEKSIASARKKMELKSTL